MDDQRCGVCKHKGAKFYDAMICEMWIYHCTATVPKLPPSMSVERMGVADHYGTDCPTFERKEASDAARTE